MGVGGVVFRGVAFRCVKVPGRGQQRQGADLAGAALGEGQGQQPAHAITRHRDRAAADFGGRVESRLQAPGGVIGEVEAALVGAGTAPVHEQGADAVRGEIAHQAAAARQIEDVAAVDQGGHEQHHRRARQAPPPGAVIEQPRAAAAPDHLGVAKPAPVRVAAIDLDAGEGGVEPPPALPGHGVAQAFRGQACEIGGEACRPPGQRRTPGQRAVFRTRQGGERARPDGHRPGQVKRQRARPLTPWRRRYRRSRPGARRNPLYHFAILPAILPWSA